jgi:hypothetical protein
VHCSSASLKNIGTKAGCYFEYKGKWSNLHVSESDTATWLRKYNGLGQPLKDTPISFVIKLWLRMKPCEHEHEKDPGYLHHCIKTPLDCQMNGDYGNLCLGFLSLCSHTRFNPLQGT